MSIERSLNVSKNDEKLQDLIKSLPADLKLSKFFSDSFMKAQQKVLPDLIAVVNKNIQKTRVVQQCNHNHSQGSLNDDAPNTRNSEINMAKLASSVKRNSVLMPSNQFILSQGLAGSKERDRSSEVTAKSVQFNVQNHRRSKSKNDPVVIKEEKSNSSSSNAISNSDSSSESIRKNFTHLKRRPTILVKDSVAEMQSLQIKQENQYGLEKMIKPILKEFQNIALESIEHQYSYLPTVLHQIKEHKERTNGMAKRRKETSNANSRVGSPSKINESSQNGSQSVEAISISVQPIESQLITQQFKNIIEENKVLQAKVEQFAREMDEMRTNYHKDLNQKSNMAHMQEKAMNQRQKDNKYGKYVDKDQIDSLGLDTSVSYFQATECVDPAMRDIFNDKIKTIKETFEKWQLKQMDYVKSVNKKLVQYQSVDSEFHGLISMPIAEILKGVALMDEEPEDLWKHILEQLGPDFFMPTIDKLYSHRFVSDIGRHQRDIEAAVMQSTNNEKLIVQESQKQLSLLAKDKSDLMSDLLQNEASLKSKVENAMLDGLERGKQISFDEYDSKMKDQESQIKNFKQEVYNLNLLAKEPQKQVEKEQMKTFISRLIFFTKQKQQQQSTTKLQNSRINDFLTGKTSESYVEKIQGYEDTIQRLQIETNTMKRSWSKIIQEIENLKNENYDLTNDRNDFESRYKMQIEKFASYDQEQAIQKKGLEDMTELLHVEKLLNQRMMAQLDKLTRGSYQMDKPSRVEHMLKTTKCMISFQGWTNQKALRDIRGKKDAQQQTEIKNVENKIIQPKKDKFPTPKEASMESLMTFDKLPLVNTGMQTSKKSFEQYMILFMKEKGYKGGLSPRSTVKKQIGLKLMDAFKHKHKEVQCDIMDNEQVTCFIWDTLCDDKELRRITDAKRNYLMAETPDQFTEMGDFIGGVKIIEKPYRQIEKNERMEMKKRIDDFQNHFGVQKIAEAKWKPLNGVFQRLWEDVGFKETRMDNLRSHIDIMIKNQLMKKLACKSNDISSFKNIVILNSFLEQVRIYVDDQIDIKNQGVSKDPLQSTALISVEPSEFLVNGTNLTQTDQASIEKKSPKKTDYNSTQERDPDEIIETCKFYINKLKNIKKSYASIKHSKSANSIQKQGDLNKHILFQLQKMNQAKDRNYFGPNTFQAFQHDYGDSKTEKNEDSVSNLVSKQAENVNSPTQKFVEEEKSTIKIEEIISSKNPNNFGFKKRFSKDLDYVEKELKVGIFDQSSMLILQKSMRPDPLDQIIKQTSSREVSKDKDATHDTNTSRMKAVSHDINPYLKSKYSEERKKDEANQAHDQTNTLIEVREEQKTPVPLKKSYSSSQRIMKSDSRDQEVSKKNNTSITLDETNNLANIIKGLPDISNKDIATTTDKFNKSSALDTNAQHLVTAEFNNQTDIQFNKNINYSTATNKFMMNTQVQTTEPSGGWLNQNIYSPASKSKLNAATPLSIQNLQLINYKKNVNLIGSKINFDKKPKTAGLRKSRKNLKQLASKTRYFNGKIDYQEIEKSQGKTKHPSGERYNENQHKRFYSNTQTNLKENEIYSIENVKPRLQIPGVNPKSSTKEIDSQNSELEDNTNSQFQFGKSDLIPTRLSTRLQSQSKLNINNFQLNHLNQENISQTFSKLNLKQGTRAKSSQDLQTSVGYKTNATSQMHLGSAFTNQHGHLKKQQSFKSGQNIIIKQRKLVHKKSNQILSNKIRNTNYLDNNNRNVLQQSSMRQLPRQEYGESSLIHKADNQVQFQSLEPLIRTKSSQVRGSMPFKPVDRDADSGIDQNDEIIILHIEQDKVLNKSNNPYKEMKDFMRPSTQQGTLKKGIVQSKNGSKGLLMNSSSQSVGIYQPNKINMRNRLQNQNIQNISIIGQKSNLTNLYDLKSRGKDFENYLMSGKSIVEAPLILNQTSQEFKSIKKITAQQNNKSESNKHLETLKATTSNTAKRINE